MEGTAEQRFLAFRRTFKWLFEDSANEFHAQGERHSQLALLS
jgi:hypothetical protein